MQDKIVIITGASSGIGKALAELYIKNGSKVVLAARSIDKLEELRATTKVSDSHILLVKTDVTQQSDCKNLIEKTIEKFGSIDVLINNAGISMRAIFEDVELDVIKQVMDINYWGTVYCTKYALPYIIKSKGSVVGVSSIAGFKGLPGRAGYSSSKFAMHGFLEVIRVETLKQGVHVLIACPGFTASNIRFVALGKDGSQQGETPMKEEKLMTSEEVAMHTYNAIVKRKRTLILTTQGKMIVLLNKFIPTFLDKVVYNHFKKEPNSPLK